MASSLVTSGGAQVQVQPVESRSRRPFLIALGVVFGLFGLLYWLALRMNHVPLPESLQANAISYSRVVGSTGMLTTTYYVDGIPKEEVIAAVRSFYKGKSVEVRDTIGLPFATGAAPRDLEVHCGIGDTCRFDFHRQLSAPELAFEKVKRAFGIRS